MSHRPLRQREVLQPLLSRALWICGTALYVTQLITACDEPKQQDGQHQVIRPVRAIQVPDPASIGGRSFTGRARAARRSDLSFEVGGRILQLPNGLNAEGIRKQCPDCEDAAMMISTTMENIGVMVYHRIVPAVVVYHLVGSSTIILYQKLAPWIDDLRTELDSPWLFEWFQWLATVLEELPGTEQQPAYDAFRDWKPARKFDRL